MIVAVYPGTFDPLTRGHEDLVRRASRIFDTLVVGVANNPNKKPFFLLQERLAIAQEALSHHTNIKVMSFSGLLKDFVRANNARVIVRGLRAVSDFEYEFQMAGMNRYLLPDVEMMFMTPSDQYQFISGTIVREIAQLGGDVSKFVFPSVEKWLRNKFAQASHADTINLSLLSPTNTTATRIIEVSEYTTSSSASI
ncbi:Phosphopantetheine adenylyltransferase [Candidatus Vallotia tarda]|uniref:Phosphopantetheine adenylyltransferase n=1 Tax=Candidatus Vallotiella hemipterorum TaxID=1177213 RepID=A0A916JSA6_9BURK|nr:Phosphopantetheine adenylyltransferase [Candidatus Vallotia tarda]